MGADGEHPMSGDDVMQLIMNPTRLRIIQYLMIHQSATTTQIRSDLEDVSKASIYRQMKLLEDANLLCVAQENRVRGAVEKVYELNKENPLGDGADPLRAGLQLIDSGLLSLMSEFNRYFAKADADPVGDLLFLSTSTLLLSDAEFKEFSAKLGEVFNQVIHNKPGEGRKVRRITFISSPSEE